ncbi:MAG: tyrosine-type recombinase/integrase [Actinobacteria bacterium]|nr:tyrosine-type recombinase/integrase [Actinomycetota bacterium]
MHTSLYQLVPIYLTERRSARTLASSSIPAVRSDLRIFATYIDPLVLSKLRAADVERFMAAHPLAQSTARKRFCNVREFCRWLVRRNFLKVDPTAGLEPPRQPKAVPRGYTREIVDRLLSIAPDHRARLIVLLEVQEGLRACEVARVELGDIDFAEGTMLVHGKGSKDRLLPISEQTWAALETYLAGQPARTGPLIRSYSEPWKGISAEHVAHLVQRWLRTAGVPRGGGHGLRHTMATTLLRDTGADIRDVQLALGHTCLSSTSVYLPFSDAKRLRTIMNGRWYGTMPRLTGTGPAAAEARHT